MKKINIFSIAIILLLCFLIVNTYGQNHIPVRILSSGGNVSSSAKFSLQSTLGQFVIGVSQGQSNSSKAGFWYVSDKKIPASIEEIGKWFSPKFDVSRNYPNPFALKTEFRLSLPKSGKVTASIYNSKGLEVGKMIDDYLDAGTYILEYTSDDLPIGVYYCRFRFDGNVIARKMVLVK